MSFMCEIKAEMLLILQQWIINLGRLYRYSGHRLSQTSAESIQAAGP